MARLTERLKPLTVKRARLAPGRYADGENLYLVVDKSGAKRWAFIYRWRDPRLAGPGRLREMGLGSLSKVDLAGARQKAEAARRLLGQGMDPIEARKADVPAPTFGDLADEFVKARSKRLRNDKSVARLKRALNTYAAGLRSTRVDAITAADVLDVLRARPEGDPHGPTFWERTPESAGLTRGYVEAVLDMARVSGHRAGDNPARWKGHLEYILPPPRQREKRHHAALPFEGVPAFVASLRAREAVAALALEFLILTAARTGEVIGAEWSEVDLNQKVWTVPGSRMKAGRQHRVPLSKRAIEILEKSAGGRAADERDGYLFPGLGNERPLSNMALAMLMRRLKVSATTHGFRSAFRDWCGEATGFPREVAEAALAHRVGDSAELAYRRGDALEKRRKLMEAWALYCEPRASKGDSPGMVSNG